MSKNKHPKFVGELNHSIVSEPIPFWTKTDLNPDDFQLQEKRILNRQWVKMGLLLKHYDIKPDEQDPWLQLSWALACDFVPGMKVVNPYTRRKGRPRKWKGSTGLELIRDVERIRNERNQGARDAIRTLIKRQPKRWGAYKQRALEVRYAEAKKYHGPFAKKPLTNKVPLNTLYEK